MRHAIFFATWLLGGAALVAAAEERPTSFLEAHCYECHDAAAHKGGLDLSSLEWKLADREIFARWVKVFDRVQAGEMPPRDRDRPAAAELKQFTSGLRGALVSADRERQTPQGRRVVRRLTRAEYENTIRDLFGLSGIALQGGLPADGSAHGFDKHTEALDISHVNVAKYVEAADHVLNMAIATQPTPPVVHKQRISLTNPGAGVAHVMLYGEALLLKDKKPHPEYPPAGDYPHIDQGAHQRMGMYNTDATVGLFRHEDESFQPYFLEFACLYPGQYRIRISLWSFQWDKGQVLPARGIEAGRLSAVQLNADGRHTGHPSYVIGYYDAPSLEPKVHEFTHWLNYKETLGFNAASLAPGAPTRGKGHAMGFTGPGIACDYLEIEGPLHEVWPPESHRLLFGDLPLGQYKPEDHPGERPPARKPLRQEVIHVINRPDPEQGMWTVESKQPLADADRLLAAFLPKAFRRPVSEAVRQAYVAQVDARLKAGDCFETAMRYAYRAALCSPDFLYHIEPAGDLDDYAVACRLAYFLWNSAPDERLTQLAAEGKLRDAGVLDQEIERLLRDPKSQRFVEDFLGQWLKLRQIAATDPDRKLYPEFSAYLQDSMVGETRAYFRELLEKNLAASYLVKSEFAMLNEKLAKHYGIDGVHGSQIRRVDVPADSARGPFLTQASILKITANGTTTSPVPRGAFVLSRLLGQPPDPPPANVPAIEPDVRGAKTIREQLDKHRADPACASCHVKMDPPGFALEAFDVIGGFRTRYRSIGEGDPAPRGNIDPFIGIGFRLGPAVDATGELPDGRKFHDAVELEKLLAAQPEKLLRNMAEQLLVYGTGREVLFADREEIEQVVAATQREGGGLRTLLHQVVQSSLFKSH
jgi:hypothetical protein